MSSAKFYDDISRNNADLPNTPFPLPGLIWNASHQLLQFVIKKILYKAIHYCNSNILLLNIAFDMLSATQIYDVSANVTDPEGDTLSYTITGRY
jgi:hypothetical protein